MGEAQAFMATMGLSQVVGRSTPKAGHSLDPVGWIAQSYEWGWGGYINAFTMDKFRRWSAGDLHGVRTIHI